MPQFTSTDKANADFYENLHIYLAYVLIALVAIHIAAAIWHHFVKRDPRGGAHDRRRAEPTSRELQTGSQSAF